MNKYITSTTGKQIEFALSSTRKVILDPIVPTEVSEIEFTLLYSRLGSSIREVDMTPSAPVVEEEKNTIVETPIEETEKEVEVSEKETPTVEEEVEETI